MYVYVHLNNHSFQYNAWHILEKLKIWKLLILRHASKTWTETAMNFTIQELPDGHLASCRSTACGVTHRFLPQCLHQWYGTSSLFIVTHSMKLLMLKSLLYCEKSMQYGLAETSTRQLRDNPPLEWCHCCFKPTHAERQHRLVCIPTNIYSPVWSLSRDR